MAVLSRTYVDDIRVTENKIVSLSFQWWIENYSSHIKEFGYYLKSSSFSLNTKDPIKWHLVAYPKGKNVEDIAYLAVFICCERDVGVDIPVPTLIELSVKKNRTHKNGLSYYYQPVTTTISEEWKNLNEWGWNRFMKTKMLLEDKRFLVDDNLLLHCRINFPCQENVRRLSLVNIPECCLRDGLGSILDKELFSDVKLIAQGKHFNVHKAILSAMSPVFDAMFSMESKDKTEGVVEIKDMEPNVLENLLKFVYTGKIDFVNFKVSSELMIASDKYGLERLKYLCEEDLCSKLTVENVLELLVLSCTLNAHQLKAKALDFAILHITSVRKTSKWPTLVSTYPQLFDEIFEHHLRREQHIMNVIN